MAEHAGSAAEAVSSIDGIHLDYGVESLAIVDGLLGRFHAEGLGPEQVGETVFTFGASIGEVIVRCADGAWIALSPGHPLGDHWPMVELPTGNLVNPVGKAFKRVENGAVDSIPFFYSCLVAGDAPRPGQTS